MNDPSPSRIGGERLLRGILLDLMLPGDALGWPGADGVTVEEVLAAYVPASRRRRVPGREESIRRPEHASEIRSSFTLAGSRDDIHVRPSRVTKHLSVRVAVRPPRD